MKLLIHSNAPWSTTGYGTQTAQLARRLARAGHEVTISAFFGLPEATMKWDPGWGLEPIQVLGSGVDGFGNDVLVRHAYERFGHAYRGGWVITLIDVVVLRTKALDQLNLASWCPVDMHPVPAETLAYFAGGGELEEPPSGAVPIAMSRFGEVQLRAAGLVPLYAPHGIDTELFAPGDRDAARATWKLPPRAFVVGMVAANLARDPVRKGFLEAFEAFGIFRDRHPDALLYCHTEEDAAPSPRGIDLGRAAARIGIRDAVRFSDTYALRLGLYQPRHLVELYRAMDVLLNPAYGEGFGVPIVEAQACGTRVVVTNGTAMAELTGPDSWAVPAQRWYRPTSDAFHDQPSIPGIVDALEAAYATRADGPWDASRAFALGYDADVVFDRDWVPLLAELEARPAPVRVRRLRAVEGDGAPAEGLYVPGRP